MPEVLPPTVPAQPESNPPLKRGLPVVITLVCIVALFGIVNVTNLLGNKKTATNSTLLTRPSAVSPQTMKSYENLQATEIRHDAADRQSQNAGQVPQTAAYGTDAIPGPEADAAPAMTAAQRQAIYGDSPDAPQHASGASQARAEAKQRELEREKQRQDALSSDTVAIDFSQQQGSSAKPSATPGNTAVLAEAQQAPVHASGEDIAAGSAAAPSQPAVQRMADHRNADPMAPYPFDSYGGQLYRVFEGTVLEGVVTNHIDGGFSGPILVMLTTDYYSHDHQQLLLPQGTRLIGNVQSVGSQGQRKLFVTFHRAVCPDGFSLDFDKYIGLDQIGTTGLASKVDNHILSSFAAAAAIGGLGGLAQIGNAASILTPSAEIRDGLSEQTAQEGEQILNHFLNRLPTITLKEGSRARIYIGRDILIPSYAEHRVDPTL